MAVVSLSEVYVPVPFNQGVDEAAVELNAFAQSGVLQGDARIDQMATVGGVVGELPFWNTLSTAAEPNLSSDNPASTSTPKNLDYGKETYRKSMLNDSWSTMDLARELGLADPLGAISRQIGQFWATQLQKRIIAGLQGVLADNVANDSGDMLHSIYSDIATPLAANLISADAVLQAKQTMGDHADNLAVIAMHSVQYTRLQSQNLIDYIPYARGEIRIPTYLGYRVIIDDSLPVTAGTNSPKYTTMLCATGALAWGRGAVPVPSELERVPDSGDGAGQDILYSRRTDIIHPYGFADTGTPAADSYTIAELQAATSWDRVRDRKNIGIAFLETN